jgi:hypothetical protein
MDPMLLSMVQKCEAALTYMRVVGDGGAVSRDFTVRDNVTAKLLHIIIQVESVQGRPSP